MLKPISILFLLALMLPISISAQKNNDPVLFTIGKTPVHVSEFKYIYTKTNGQNADFSKKSLEEYLELYTKFKLKVQKAKEMRLDTLTALKAELDGYRRQLADSYLIDREVTDRLVKELYERIQQDVDISHILIAIGEANAQPTPSDTLKAYQEAVDIKKRLDKGEDFFKLAEELSDDSQAKFNGGQIGWVNASMLPGGFYDLETAAYTVPVGKISNVVRTRAGYHIVKVNARRAARGEIEVAHILARAENENFELAKAKIDKIYALLKAPDAKFEEIARNNSEDELTAQRDGYLGIFGIARYERSFENAAFSIPKDGDFSEPIRTSVGYHIIKRISLRTIQPFNIEKSRLENKIKQDSRYEQARVAMGERIRKENNFKENLAPLQKLIASETDTFFTFRWRTPDEKPKEVLFTIGTSELGKGTVAGFYDFLSRSTGKRLRLKEDGLEKAIRTLYKEFLEETTMKFEETQLEKKYPDFKALMREYEEGILLFEATKNLVWDKASQDSVGLERFFETVKQNYKWEERAVVSNYKISPEGRVQATAIQNYAAIHTPEEVLKNFNSDEKMIVSVEERAVERKPENPSIGKTGEMSTPQVNRDGSTTFSKTEKLLPPGQKSLKEARGYVIADYQDYLEKLWVEQLKKEYKVSVDRKVFESLIKS